MGFSGLYRFATLERELLPNTPEFWNVEEIEEEAEEALEEGGGS